MRNPGAWINLAYSVRRAERIEQAEAILLKGLVSCNPPTISLKSKSDWPSILIKTFGAWHSTAMTPLSEASECSSTVKYHDVCRSVQNTLFQNPAWRVDGEREPGGELALVMASARDRRIKFQPKKKKKKKIPLLYAYNKRLISIIYHATLFILPLDHNTLHLKNVVAAVSLGHRGDIAFPH